MELEIRAGKRVLYKHNNQWEVGELTDKNNPELTDKGLFLPIMPINSSTHITNVEINEIFLDAVQLEDWMKGYKDIFMTKEEYIQFVESEEFSKAIEQSYVSDGEYYYYPVSRYNRNWIEKQPFDYVVRMT